MGGGKHIATTDVAKGSSVGSTTEELEQGPDGAMAVSKSIETRRCVASETCRSEMGV
jgi:hypothetical protein